MNRNAGPAIDPPDYSYCPCCESIIDADDDRCRRCKCWLREDEPEPDDELEDERADYLNP